ncbi:hypothetical protein Aca07nite_85810 [Actinoplanes capillaceus]|uniref:SnoaL-like domain-containing protein n=1 Tax=Actinoplanes campanulatus TaxID=113559 RepID=A0ABQ3WYD6_9ACTN|nr:hypothetical protein [Actinoplanes capillaceus]GID51306.1 hypothetical protein Aca07nite_85810 [Actinoplanes capillaceus]
MGTAETARRWARVWRRAWPEQDLEAIAALQAEHGDHWASMFRRYVGRDGLIVESRDYSHAQPGAVALTAGWAPTA